MTHLKFIFLSNKINKKKAADKLLHFIDITLHTSGTHIKATFGTYKAVSVVS